LAKLPLKPKEHGIVVEVAANDRKRNSKRWRMRWMLWLTKMPRRPASLACLVFLVFPSVDCLALDQVSRLLLFLVSVLAQVLLHRLCHSHCLDSTALYHHRLCPV
jgi:hypothetical protein